MKSLKTSYLLWICSLGGILGIHRYYLGRWISGSLWLCTGGLFLVGALVDLLLLPRLVQEENITRMLLAEAAVEPSPQKS